ncbi:hypothetical protein ACC675_37495, partial [Rhizobium ruizarguesonis]
ALAALLSVPKLRCVAFYRTAMFLPTLFSFVIVGFIWKLILSPIWGVAPWMLDLIGLKFQLEIRDTAISAEPDLPSQGANRNFKP